MNAQSPHKWWSTLKSAVFGFSSSLLLLVGGGGGLVCESVGKADLLSDHFDGKQSRESVDLPLTCHPSPCLTSFAFRSLRQSHRKRKLNLGKQQTVDYTLEPIQRSGVKHSLGKVIPHSNLSRQGRPSKLGRSTP